MNIHIIIEFLVKNFGYILLDLKDINGLSTEWALMRKFQNHISIVVFGEMNLIDTKLDETVKSKLWRDYGTDDAEIIKVIITDSEVNFIPVVEEYRKARTNIEDVDSIIIVGSSNGDILYNGTSNLIVLEDLTRVFRYVVNSKRKTVNEKSVPAITYSIIAINVVIFLISSIFSNSILNSTGEALIKLGALFSPLIKEGEYFRFITCMFLHGGLIHIAFNMYFLYSLGPVMEKVYGKLKFLIIYFVSGVASSLLSYAFSSPNSVSVGASGAIFGLLGAALIYGYKMKKRIGKEFYTNILSAIVVNLIIGLSMPHIDNYAHIGGLIGGVIVSIIFLGTASE